MRRIVAGVVLAVAIAVAVIGTAMLVRLTPSAPTTDARPAASPNDPCAIFDAIEARLAEIHRELDRLERRLHDTKPRREREAKRAILVAQIAALLEELQATPDTC